MNLEEIKNAKTKSLLAFAIPSIIAMIITTLITITDGVFIGNFVGDEAIAAVNLGLPIEYLFLGLGLCTGVGGMVLASQAIGRNNHRQASQIFSQTLLTTLIICILTSGVVYFTFDLILNVLGATGILAEYFKAYFSIMLIGFPLLVLQTVLGMFVRADGKPQFCMLVNILSFILNIILDYIFVVKLSLGIEGSAWASVLVEFVALLVSLGYFVKGSSAIRFSSFQFDREIFTATLANGSSEFIGEMASAVSMFVYNAVIMKAAGYLGVTAFSVLGFCVFAYSMIAIGFGQGMSPLSAMFYGAKDYESITELRKITARLTCAVGAVFAVVFFFFGRTYAGFFGSTPEVLEMVATGFKIYAVTFVLAGFDTIASMHFTCCSDAKRSAIISSLRGLVLLIPLTLLLSACFGMTGVWLTAPLTELITAIVAVKMLHGDVVVVSLTEQMS